MFEINIQFMKKNINPWKCIYYRSWNAWKENAWLLSQTCKIFYIVYIWSTFICQL